MWKKYNIFIALTISFLLRMSQQRFYMIYFVKMKYLKIGDNEISKVKNVNAMK